MRKDKFKRLLKLKNPNYYDRNLLILKIMLDSNWDLVEQDMVYGGMSMEDVDEMILFYNQNKNKAIQIITNHYVKSTNIKKIPVKKLEYIINRKKK